MTEPVEEEGVRAPLDDPDEDEVMQPRTLDDISSLEDLETPRAPDDVADAVEEGMEADEAGVEGVIERTPEEYAEEEAIVPPSDEPGEEDEKGEAPSPEGHTVKINGEEYTLSTEDLISGYQQAAASQQKFQQAAQTERATKEIMDKVLDPNSTIETMVDLYEKKFDGDRAKAADVVDEIIGKRVQHLIDLEEMSEGERQVYDLTAEKERMAAELDAHRAQREEAERQEYINYQNSQAVPLLDRAIAQYNLEVGSAQDVEASQILAEYIRQGQPVTQELVNETVSSVINRRTELLQNTLTGMSAQDLMMANPELAQQVQQRNVEDIKASRTTETGASQGSNPKRRRKARKSTDYTDSNEFFNDTDF